MPSQKRYSVIARGLNKEMHDNHKIGSCSNSEWKENLKGLGICIDETGDCDKGRVRQRKIQVTEKG